MKTRLISSILICAAAFSMTSCLNDLNVQQPGTFTGVSMWQDENDATSAIDGTYNRMRTTYKECLVAYGDLRTNFYCSGSVGDTYYNTTGGNKLNSNWKWTNWANFYTTINDANLVLKHVPDIKFANEEKRNEILASALFVRAYCYYTIARVWGDAPLLTKGIESADQDDVFPTRESASKIYEQIEADLEEAIKLMPASVSYIYKATPASINMLRADYYTWKATRLGGGNAALTIAKNAIDAVISNKQYQIQDNFADVFSPSKKENAEIIMAFPWKIGEGGMTATSYDHYIYSTMLASLSFDRTNLQSKGYTEDQVPTGSLNQYITLTPEYYDILSEDPADTRCAVSAKDFRNDPFLISIFIKTMIVKFKGSIQNGQRTFDNDMPIYRLAEAYLLKAEIENALGNKGEAAKALNVIAKRAYGVDNKYSENDNLTQAIINENLKEFVAEGKIWWVYLRMNQEFEQISTLAGRQGDNQGNVLLWPIAAACINTNSNIKQTPGYN